MQVNGHVLRYLQLMAASGLYLNAYAQELEGRLHWAVWGFEQGFLQPESLAPAAKGSTVNLVEALEHYFVILDTKDVRMGIRALAGAEKDNQRLASRLLAFLKLVRMSENGLLLFH